MNNYQINLICYNKSQSIDDWGIKFIENRNVILFTLNRCLSTILNCSNVIFLTLSKKSSIGIHYDRFLVISNYKILSV